ncbi:MAG TPA: carbohydrate ABC transporter permease [Deltaproteobacteria bacterium]|nr:carbohydrate ABC transporter permease [Deltaproteobacteria bacterium]
MRGALSRSAFAALALALAALSLFPFVWFLLTSLKSAGEVTAIPPSIVPDFSLRSYVSVFGSRDLGAYLANSVVVAASTTALSMTAAVLAGYAFARTSMKGRRLLFALVLAVSMFPQISIAGPVWRILRWAGWLNTYQGLVVPYVSLTLPLAVWLMAAFFRDFPRELERAALMDGCTRLGALVRVVLPLSAPGVFTASILVFIYAWNEFFFALLIMTDPAMQTLPVGIALFPGEFTMPWGEIAAASVVATLPLVAVVLAFQRRIIRGLTAGSVKG